MDLRDQALSIDCAQHRLDCQVLSIRSNELVVLQVIMHILINILSPFTIMDQTVTQLVQEV